MRNNGEWIEDRPLTSNTVKTGTQPKPIQTKASVAVINEEQH
jgi:hypothetical protein